MQRAFVSQVDYVRVARRSDRSECSTVLKAGNTEAGDTNRFEVNQVRLSLFWVRIWVTGVESRAAEQLLRRRTGREIGDDFTSSQSIHSQSG